MVDEFLDARVQPRLRPAAEAIRALMRELAPDASEVISYGIPAWRRRRVIAVLSPTKVDLTLAFSRGAEFEDPYGLLRGVGKVSRHLKVTRAEDLSREAIAHYVRQALALDGYPPLRPGQHKTVT